MTAAELLQSVNRAGFALRCEGDAILVAPAGRLPEELREAVKTHRRELLSLLHQPPVNVVPPPASPDPRLFDRPEAERRLAALRADVAAAEARQPGGRFPPRVGRVVRTWLEVAEGYVANGDTEAARGWDAMRLLDGAAVYARDEAGGQAYRREAAARPTDLLDPE